MIKRLLGDKRGDTIVEVTLALTVLALVLGTSSVLANRNTKTLQNAQEKNVAVRYAQQQIEFLKNKAVSDISVFSDYMDGKNFCMTNGSSSPVELKPDTCKIANGGADYIQKITFEPVEGEADIYNAKAVVEWDTLTSWTDASGSTQNKGSVQLTYRVYTKLGAKKSPLSTDCLPGKAFSETLRTCVDAPSVTLSGSASSIENGTTFRLSWSTNHVSSCTASGNWSGSKGFSGYNVATSYAGTGSKSFALTCQGEGGLQASHSVDLTVRAKPARKVLYSCFEDTAPWGFVVKNHGLVHEQVPGRACERVGYHPEGTNAGAVRLWRTTRDAVDDFYTMSWQEASNASVSGYVMQSGPLFYVYPNCTHATGLVSLYRFWNPTITNHYYSTNRYGANSLPASQGGGGYGYEGVEGCIFSSS